MRAFSALSATLSLFAFASLVSVSLSQEKPGSTFTVGGGTVSVTAPAGWVKKEPMSNIIEAEYSIPPVGGDEMAGRMTAMGAGGSLEDNVNRWVGQFVGPGGAAAKPQRDKATIDGAQIEIVDLSGAYKDSMGGGPFAGGKTVTRENYRMLGAIIQTKGKGNYFLKLYGPKATIDASAAGFQEMVKSVKVK